jgi:hypothetical protein
MPVIPALWRLEQEDHKFKDSLRLYLNSNNNKKLLVYLAGQIN